MKRNPEKILNSLTQHSSDLAYKFERLYRLLFNEEMYYIAYQRIYTKQGNMTKGVDGKTIDGFCISHIERLIGTLKDETYQPNPSQRVYIPKKNGKMRPLGIPSFIDKLLQEVIRMILEAIYEGSFENSSHGFRPQRSPQTALWSIQKTFNNTKWFIEGDIKGFFDNIDHEVLIAILSERISDMRFLRLIRKFLNAGYVEDWVFHKSYSGTPQGGIISPILANIYLDKFDKYIKEYTQKFNKGKRRKENPIAKQLGQKKYYLTTKLKQAKNETERRLLLKQIEEVVKERFDRLLAEVQAISAQVCGRDVHTVQEVLVEEPDSHVEGLVTGRMSNNTIVHFPGGKELIGKIVKVYLEESKGFYYMGSLVD